MDRTLQKMSITVFLLDRVITQEYIHLLRRVVSMLPLSPRTESFKGFGKIS